MQNFYVFIFSFLELHNVEIFIKRKIILLMMHLIYTQYIVKLYRSFKGFNDKALI